MLTDSGMAINHDMRLKRGVVSNANIVSYDTKWTDANVVADLGGV